MAGIPIAFNDVLHQYSGGSLHKRFKIKRQGRDPLSQPDVDSPSSTTDTGNSLSLGRPSDITPTPTDEGDDDDEDTTSSEPTTTRARTSTTSTSSVSTPTTTDDPDTSTTETTTESSTTETSTTPSVITTTIESTSTLTSYSSIETTTEPTTTLPDTTSLPTSTSATTRALVTSIVTASLSRSSSASNSLASSASDSSSSSGPSTGTVVGIVAGALVGVVVLSGIVGYVFRTKCSNKNDEDDFDGENPFGSMDHDGGFGHRTGASRSELRRDSQLLADEGDSIHQMSELGHGMGGMGGMGGGYGNNAAPIGAMGAGAAAAGAYALHRGDSTGQNSNNLPGLQRGDTMNPRPPTMIQRHYAAQQHQQQQQSVPHMPSFQPGQIVYPSAQINQSGPYPTFPNNNGNAAVPIGGVFPSSGNSNNGHGGGGGGGNLNRNQSYREQYPTNAMNGNGDYQYGDNNNDYADNIMQQQRSGTPEYANPQQYFHQASDSFGSGVGVSSPFDDGNASPARNAMQQGQGQQYQHHNHQYNNSMNARYDAALNNNNNGPSEALYADNQPYSSGGRDGAMKGSERAKRTLSVRNGGAIDEEGPRDSVYGGM